MISGYYTQKYTVKKISTAKSSAFKNFRPKSLLSKNFQAGNNRPHNLLQDPGAGRIGHTTIRAVNRPPTLHCMKPHIFSGFYYDSPEISGPENFRAKKFSI
jgi:hypothetical protein